MATPNVNSYTHVPFSDHHLYHVNVHGSVFTITVTASASVTDMWARNVMYENAASLTAGRTGTTVVVVGIGIMFHQTLQLCVGNRSLVFQLVHADIVPQSLRNLLLERACRFVDFGNGQDDRSFLLESRHALELARDIVNVRSFLQPQHADFSLQEIARTYLGYEVVNFTRCVVFSDWSVVTLSHEQVLQASLQVRCACLIAQLRYNNGN